MARESLVAEVKQLIVEQLELRDVTADGIVAAAPLFGEGLGLDSLDALQLAMALEERYGVVVPDDERAREVFASVDSLVAFIERATPS